MLGLPDPSEDSGSWSPLKQGWEGEGFLDQLRRLLPAEAISGSRRCLRADRWRTMALRSGTGTKARANLCICQED